VKGVDLRVVFIAIAIIGLIGKGVLLRTGTWSGVEWMRFLLHLAACACLAALPWVVPQQSLNPDWPPAAQIVYLVTELGLMIYGVFSGIWLLKAFAGGAPPPRVLNAMLFTFIGLTLAFGVAAWLEHAAVVPFQQSGAIILGIFCLWIGASLPEWVEGHPMFRQIAAIISETGTRLFYAAAGLALIGFGLLGRAHIFK
jgi:hypothetical protein